MSNKTIKILALSLMIQCLAHSQLFALDLYSTKTSLNVDPARTISMDFKNAQLNDVLKIFSQQSGLNFIASVDVASKIVNLYLDKVPVEEALERILSANNLTYELKPDSNIFTVKELLKPAKDLVTRIYRLKFASVDSSQIRSALSSGSSSSSSGSSSSSSSSSSTTSTSTSGEGESSGGSGLTSAIKNILSSDGSLVEDPRTNSLIITDIPAQFPLIEQTIARLDVRIPQILIEVEMLDISKTNADLIGAKWSDTPITFKGAEKDDIFPFNQDDAVEDLTPVGDDLDKTLLLENQYRVSTLSFAGLRFTLNFLRTQTDTKNLARPRILTLNNETAEIQITTDEAIGILNTTSSSDGSANTTLQAERVPTGVSLKVTPQASLETEEITMAIQPTVSQARAGGTFGSGAGQQTFKDPETRLTKSLLRVRDGDTIILGGLLRTDYTRTDTQVPVISKIPIIGNGFKHKNLSDQQRELIIFITPHIVQENLALPNEKEKQESLNLVREQDIPKVRNSKIDRELSLHEK